MLGDVCVWCVGGSVCNGVGVWWRVVGGKEGRRGR